MFKKLIKRLQDKQGSILLMSMYVMGSLVIVGSAFGVLIINDRLSAQHQRQAIQAIYLAEAGIEQAVYNLKQDFGTSGSWRDGHINADVFTPDVNNFQNVNVLVDLGVGKYTIAYKSDGVNADKIWVKSTGLVGNHSQTIDVHVTVTNPVGPVVSVMGWKSS